MSQADGYKTVCVDFDGVLAVYAGWKTAHRIGDPLPGAVDFLVELRKRGFKVVIYSARPSGEIWNWLTAHGMVMLVKEVVYKPPAVAYVDDRALRFDGDFTGLARDVVEFRAWWKEE